MQGVRVRARVRARVRVRVFVCVHVCACECAGLLRGCACVLSLNSVSNEVGDGGYAWQRFI